MTSASGHPRPLAVSDSGRVHAGDGRRRVARDYRHPYKKLPYEPAKDFAPIVLVAFIPFVLVVHPSLPVRSVPELVTYAREDPIKLSYASGGPGSPHQLLLSELCPNFN
jgi:hypothetical protein